MIVHLLPQKVNSGAKKNWSLKSIDVLMIGLCLRKGSKNNTKKLIKIIVKIIFLKKDNKCFEKRVLM